MMRLTLRGFSVWWRENPRLLLSVLICGIADALTPYVNIWLLARLIDEIAVRRDPQILTAYTLTLIGTNAVLSLLCAGLTRWKNIQLACLWHTQNKVFMEKLLSMDFADMDDGHVQELRSRIWQNTDSGGWGLYRLIYSFDAIVSSVMSIIGAIFLTASLFLLPVTAGSGRLTILNHPAFILLSFCLLWRSCSASHLLHLYYLSKRTPTGLSTRMKTNWGIGYSGFG